MNVVEIFQDWKRICIDEIQRVEDAYKLIHENDGEFKFSLDFVTDSQKIDLTELLDLGYYSFLARLSFNSITIKEIIQSSKSPDEFSIKELSIGILLRSCLLDCLHALAWVKDPELIKKFAFESFEKLPKESMSEDEKKIMSIISNFLNIDDVKRPPSTKELLGMLGDEEQFRNMNRLYMWYSKYDHFSPMPFMLNRHFEARTLDILSSIVCIRMTLLFLHIRFGKESLARVEAMNLLRG